MVDVKWSPGGRQSAFARALAQSVRLAGMADEVTFCGQNWPVLQRLRVIDPGLRVYYSIGAQRQLAAFGHVPQDETLRGVCLHQSLLNAQLIDIFKRRGLAIWTWAVDDLAQARQLVAMGIDGIISNRLDVLGALSEAPAEGAGLAPARDEVHGAGLEARPPPRRQPSVAGPPAIAW